MRAFYEVISNGNGEKKMKSSAKEVVLETLVIG